MSQDEKMEVDLSNEPKTWNEFFQNVGMDEEDSKKYESKMIDERITISQRGKLTPDDLKELGFPLGHRIMILEYLTPAPQTALQGTPLHIFIQAARAYEKRFPEWWSGGNSHSFADDVPIYLALEEIWKNKKKSKDLFKKLMEEVAHLNVNTVGELRKLSRDFVRSHISTADFQRFLFTFYPRDELDSSYFVQLLKDSEYGEDYEFDTSIVRRAITRLTNLVNYAVVSQSPATAAQAYQEASTIPQTATEIELAADGYQLDGNLFNNPSIFLCFDGTVPGVLKTLMNNEFKRMAHLEEKLKKFHGGWHKHIISFKLQSVKSKCIAVMPFLPTTMDALQFLPALEEMRLWKQMASALEYLHRANLAHMDVKPSNIGIDINGDFVLIDLGSCVEPGQRTQTTLGFVPSGMSYQVGSFELDWWMLAASLMNKSSQRSKLVKPTVKDREQEDGLGTPQKNAWGVGASNPSARQLWEFLQHYHQQFHKQWEVKVESGHQIDFE